MSLSPFQQLLSETLSFYQELTIEEIILSFDKLTIEGLNELTVDDLRSELENLKKQKVLVINKNSKGQLTYKRRLAPRGRWSILLLKLEEIIAKVQSKL